LGTDDFHCSRTPETISGVLRNVPANAEIQFELLLVGEPDGVVLALEDGLLDKLDGLKVFGFYLVHRKVIYRL